MELNDFTLSAYGRASSMPSPVNRMMSAFASDFRPGTDINLGVGYVNERTIPNQQILEALQAVLARPEKYKAALNYGGPSGSYNLIQSIKNYYTRNRLGGLTEDILDRKEIIIGPSGATSLLEAAAHILEPGIVISPDPMYYIYCNFLERLGYQVVTVPEDHNGIRTGLLKTKLKQLGSAAEKISFLYIVTINNPTGSILNNQRREELISIGTGLAESLGRKIPILIDKAYEDLVHDPSVEPLTSCMVHDRHNLVYEIGTLSKILSPALRIGYMVGADSPFLQAMIQKTSDVGFSAPLINQEIASYMLDHHIASQTDSVNEGYRQKAAVIDRWIEQKLGPHLADVSGGQAGFYFYLTFSAIETTEKSAFFRYLTRTTGDQAIDGTTQNPNPRVLYVPGEFCVHPRGDMVAEGKRQLRLSYGFEELENIEKAITYMQQAIEYARGVQQKA